MSPDINKSNENQAIAWARSLDYPVPDPPNGCLNILVTVCGFILGFIPGIIWIFYADKLKREYKKRIEALVDKWIEAGKPEPGLLTSVANQQADVQTSSSIASVEEKIQRLNELKENGVITDDEYEQIRTRILDDFSA